jgi:NADH:ubiquinone oxidoreductase subunit 5 (subunit L)/multisubunit Na+/H+ antiporter MnhA subunit
LRARFWNCGRGAALAKGYVTEWNLPFGVPLFAWTVRLNALSVCFQLALSLLAAAVSVYSFGYLRKMEGRRTPEFSASSTT